MSIAQNNNEQHTGTNKPSVPEKHEDTEQHLELKGYGEDNAEPADPVNQPEQHITKEEFKQRESGQASSSQIPPPDDAPNSL